jgi:beta-glucosidase
MSTIHDLLQKMTLKEKISITSGFDTWRLKGFESLGIPKITVCDGPHGLRQQEEGQDHLGINESNPSTCFPPACLSAASCDEDLLFEMGQAIGFEALCQNVQVVLGPGVNIKRNPLCGRNFEYFSEDPVLAGKMAAGWIKGVQSMGVGTSLKHFALNSQELNRMKSDSITDEKAKFDIYLKAFEIPLKTAGPMTVMGSYNLVDGIYASENKWLIDEVLRNKFGFQGLLMTDWGAMNDKISSMMAGLDLEMPGSSGYFDEEVEEAIKDGRLKEAYLDQAVIRILQLITTVTEERQKALASVGPLVKSSVDIEKHHGLAKKIAMESMILLKNDRKTLTIS